MFILSLAVIIGMILGLFTGKLLTFDISNIIQFGLYLVLFFIGIDIGSNKNILKDLKRIDRKVLFLPFIIIWWSSCFFNFISFFGRKCCYCFWYGLVFFLSH